MKKYRKRIWCARCMHNLIYKTNAVCRGCHIGDLRKWVQEIEYSKFLIGQALSEPNKLKWDAMTSQRKKLFVFQAMEAGIITYKIEAHKPSYGKAY